MSPENETEISQFVDMLEDLNTVLEGWESFEGEDLDTPLFHGWSDMAYMLFKWAGVANTLYVLANVVGEEALAALEGGDERANSLLASFSARLSNMADVFYRDTEEYSQDLKSVTAGE